MGNSLPFFEIEDISGSSSTFTGTVGTSLTAIPSSAGNKIQTITVMCDPSQLATNRIFIYTDGGTNIAATIFPGGFYSTDIKGSPTQFHIKGNVSSVKYNIVIDREQP